MTEKGQICVFGYGIFKILQDLQGFLIGPLKRGEIILNTCCFFFTFVCEE